MKTLLFSVLIFSSSSIMAKSLCSKDEKALFECKKHNRSFALCASNDLALNKGSLQYRSSRNGRIEFKFPENLRGSASSFKANMTGNEVAVVFANKGYDFSLSTDIRDNDTIKVSHGSKVLTRISCRDENANDTDLAMTSTINLLIDAEVMK